VIHKKQVEKRTEIPDVPVIWALFKESDNAIVIVIFRLTVY